MHKPYSTEPEDPDDYIARNDRYYSRFARLYDRTVRIFPVWMRWIGAVLPYIKGPNVLEASFGTGELLTRYAGNYYTFGLDYNLDFIHMTARKLHRKGIQAALLQGDIYHLPYASGSFQTIVNTMAFTGYPRALPALSEMHRVLAPGGLLLMVDIGIPANRNPLGMVLASLWRSVGDILRDMPPLFEAAGFQVEAGEIGGFGTVHLYRARKAKVVGGI